MPHVARAALAIQRSLADLNCKNANSDKPALAARIAIDLGPVVVDATGEIFGNVPNVAAGHRRWPNRVRSWSQRGCSAKSWPKIAAAMI
jgi:hypothetical protein